MTKNLFFLLALVGSLAIFQSACTEDCTKDCVNGFADENCDCQCDTGYEYDAAGLCTVESRAKFVGQYIVKETAAACTGDTTPYVVTITPGTGLNDLKIQNFYASTGSVNATFAGDSIFVAKQAIGTDFKAEAKGVYSATPGKGIITISYKILAFDTEATLATCTSTVYTKQ